MCKIVFKCNFATIPLHCMVLEHILLSCFGGLGPHLLCKQSIPIVCFWSYFCGGMMFSLEAFSPLPLSSQKWLALCELHAQVAWLAF